MFIISARKRSVKERSRADPFLAILRSMIQKISRLDAHHRLLIAIGVALVVAVVIPRTVLWPTRLVLIWLAYALTVLGLIWLTIFRVKPHEMKQFYRLQDSSRTLIFVFVILAAAVSVFAVIKLLAEAKTMSRFDLAWHVALSGLSVVSAWALVHTVFTMRYAHLYYDDDDSDDESSGPAGGLQFPDDDEPDYLDFAYFAFVIGMTGQVSDVAVSSKKMRRLALAHGLLSFFFNAIIVALTINTISGMLS